ncbi:MAG: hypothetical protein KDA32_00560 [Phycisphaerales bacterium]|nr:hypothetical protein [Phycisphaerales bacterium]
MRPGLILTIALVTTLAGCRTVRQEAPYYIDGPQQPGPPDGFLPDGTQVLVLGSAGSYSTVWADNGVIAQISTAALDQPSLDAGSNK